MCLIVAKNHYLGTKPHLHKKGSVSNISDNTNQENINAAIAQDNQTLINFHVPTNPIPCLGKKKGGNIHSDCINITYDDFIRLVDFKPAISSLASDFIKTLTNGKIDLNKFERDMSHYREKEHGF